uniref:Single Cache domain 2-containing protein n=1 Tax=Candidatus Kentrum sp. TC TaxID=2126339 RepID=A0A450YAE9_9GAMM|nr:MAG: Single Cache domain 2-containing protein [Candidatus Kentron sp. TC]VFK39884.1 MAG: Single Cache domain 2-containing protein [Candidatus Kentron sp. TC]VFK54164.1 MAG: Single Cache domain 2-containing protein [Candidatus Kentron sp. TC]
MSMKKFFIAFIVSTLAYFSPQAFAADKGNATTEECVQQVQKAAALVVAEGLEEAIKVIGNPKGPFVWKDSYVFLMDLEGKMLAHPMQPQLTHHKHVLLHTDPTDKAIFVHFINVANNTGKGWVSYMWPKPGKSSPSKKLTYVYKVDSENVLVGAGVYIGGMMY